MRKELYEYISQNEDLLLFIRSEPEWYKRLSRNPGYLPEFEKQARIFLRKTWPDRIERFTNSIQMAQMMFHMFRSFQDQ